MVILCMYEVCICVIHLQHCCGDVDGTFDSVHTLANICVGQ